MQKDFQKWHQNKSRLHFTGNRAFFHEREAWWCRIGVNVGFEQDGKGTKFARPIVIVAKFNNEIFWGLPLATVMKSGKFYLPVEVGDGRKRTVIVSQLRLMDAKCLMGKMGTVDKNDYLKIKQTIIRLLGVSPV